MEVRCIADFILYIEADLGAKLPNLIFATDAMGASDSDAGGYCVVGSEVTHDLMLASLRARTHPMRTIAKLASDVSRLLGKDGPLDPHVQRLGLLGGSGGIRLPISLEIGHLHFQHFLGTRKRRRSKRLEKVT